METVTLTIDGRSVTVPEGTTILGACQQLAIEVPTLCWLETLTPVNACRVCVVEVEGARVLVPSCARAVEPGMKVQTASERAVKSQKMVLEMLLADMPAQGHRWVEDDARQPHGELSEWATRLDVKVRPALQALSRAASVPADWQDLSHPAMAVNLDACIQCDRCVRACGDHSASTVRSWSVSSSGATLPALSPAQREVVERGLLNSGFSTVLQMPTGAGKTWLAEQAIEATLEAGDRESRPAIRLAPVDVGAADLVQGLA